MTQEMNKIDRLHPCRYKFCQYYFIPETEQCEKCLIKPKERKLDDWIKPFVDSVNERFKQCGKQ